MPDTPLHEVTAATAAETASDDAPGPAAPAPAPAPLTSLGSNDAPVCADGACAL